jgi:predicted DCC family thiol-disulfide oxidoreductase YuxK
MGTIATSENGASIAGIDASQGVLPEGVTMADAMHDVHAVDAEGTLHKGIDAVFLVFDQYPYLQWLAKFGRLPGVYLLSKALYRIVEKSRYYIWGRKR